VNSGRGSCGGNCRGVADARGAARLGGMSADVVGNFSARASNLYRLYSETSLDEVPVKGVGSLDPRLNHHDE